jgi:diguanylate cyclase (GGDEF)-like protein
MVWYFLVIETVAVGLVVFFALRDELTGRDWYQFFLISTLGILQAEASRKIEKARRLITKAPHVNMTSVWVFAAATVLPPVMTGVLSIVVYLHLWLRIWRKIGNRPIYRVAFSAAIVVLSAYATKGVLQSDVLLQRVTGWNGPTSTAIAVVLGACTYLLVNITLVAVATKLYGQPTRLVLSLSDYALEIATLCLGALAALALVHTDYLVVLVLPPLLVLHRAVLVKQLEELAVTDQKTGLLNATAWHEGAKNELSRAARYDDTFGVLMVDLDHFKRVNDTYGHLAGDEVLKSIARLLKDEIRDYDSAGRFGGEEFAVLVPSSTADQVVATAERLRQRVTELVIIAPTENGEAVISGLSASIGVAIYPNSGTTLEQLMLTADSAVYTAKSNGRNQVVTLST